MTILRMRGLAILGFTITLSACSILQPQADSSRFFVLTPTAEPATQQRQQPLRLGLGPIGFPAYLERPQMVTRVGANEINLSEIHRWGAPLEDTFARVLAQNLAEVLGTLQVTPYPWYSTQELDYAIRIEVIQFDVDQEGSGRLLARWRIVDANSDKMLRTGLADLRDQAADSSPDAAVAALSRLVEKLSRELAAGLEAVGR